MGKHGTNYDEMYIPQYELCPECQRTIRIGEPCDKCVQEEDHPPNCKCEDCRFWGA